MLGMTSHPHHNQFVPKFCKSYAQLGHIVQDGLAAYKNDVETGEFPGNDFSPYVMKDDEKKLFDDLLSQDATERQINLETTAANKTNEDEYEKLQLYGQGKGRK